MNNLVKRTLVGVVFLAVMVSSLIFSPILFGAVFMVILYFAMSEFFAMSLQGLYPLQQKLAILAAEAAFLVLYIMHQYGAPGAWMAVPALLLALIAVSSVFLSQGEREGFERMPYVFAGLVYIGLPVALSPCLAFHGPFFDGTLLLALFIIIWVSDTGAYCVGTALGQRPGSRKLAPSISPKKSWWGVAGGVLFAVGAGVALHFIPYFRVFSGISVWHCVALGVIVAAGGIMGDLYESVWKRHFGVKDSGTCIPGHGGMLDRFDSSLVAIPLAAIYLVLTGLL